MLNAHEREHRHVDLHGDSACHVSTAPRQHGGTSAQRHISTAPRQHGATSARCHVQSQPNAKHITRTRDPRHATHPTRGPHPQACGGAAGAWSPIHAALCSPPRPPRSHPPTLGGCCSIITTLNPPGWVRHVQRMQQQPPITTTTTTTHTHKYDRKHRHKNHSPLRCHMPTVQTPRRVRGRGTAAPHLDRRATRDQQRVHILGWLVHQAPPLAAAPAVERVAHGLQGRAHHGVCGGSRR
eukprot:365653-Chlamydomonas_euryale.AAC.5